jgi:hypothetical protein
MQPMFSTEADPLTLFYVELVSRYPGTCGDATMRGPHFVESTEGLERATLLVADDLVDRFMELATLRGTCVDRILVETVIHACDRAVPSTEIPLFRYTIA